MPSASPLSIFKSTIMKDIQDRIQEMKEEHKANRLGNTNQVTIGQLLADCKTFAEDDNYKDQRVFFDFCNYHPIGFCSWRGSYEEFALISTRVSSTRMTLSEFYNRLKGCVGQTFEGWKGGDFVMTEQTPVWVVDEPRNVGSTAVVGLIQGQGYFIIQTEYIEY